MEVDQGLNEMVVMDWYTDDSAEVQQLLDGYVQLTLRYKRLNIIPSDWSGEERYIWTSCTLYKFCIICI